MANAVTRRAARNHAGVSADHPTSRVESDRFKGKADPAQGWRRSPTRFHPLQAAGQEMIAAIPQRGTLLGSIAGRSAACCIRPAWPIQADVDQA